MADEKKITEITDEEGVNTLDYTARLAQATANIDRVKSEGEAYKNKMREEEAKKAKDEAKLQGEEKRRLDEEERKRKKIAEERLAALSYAETYRERLRKERDNAALEKRRMEAERRRKEQLEKELEANNALIEQQRRENSDRTAKFDEIIARINTAMTAPQKVDTPPVKEEKTEAQNPAVAEEKIEQAQTLKNDEPAAAPAYEEEENYVLNISTEDVGRELLHIEGMSVGDISLGTTAAETLKEKNDTAFTKTADNSVGIKPLASGALPGVLAAQTKKESEINSEPSAAPAVSEKNATAVQPITSEVPLESEKKDVDFSPATPAPVASEKEAKGLGSVDRDKVDGEKLSRAEQKKREREEYKRFLAENGKKGKVSPTVDADPYEHIEGGVYDISEPSPSVSGGKNTDLSDIDKYEKEIESRGASSVRTDSKTKVGKKSAETPEGTEPTYPDPSDNVTGKSAGKETRKQKKEAQERERQALLEADRLAREEEKRKAALKAKADTELGKTKEYPDYDESKEKAKRDKRAEGEELASLAKEDEKNRRKKKGKGGKDKPRAATISEPKGEKFDKKRIDATVKEQSKNDDRFIKLHFENRIRALKFESDSLDLRFSAPAGKEKRNRAKVGYSIRETKKNLKLASKLEKADNERYYNLVKCDLKKTKLPRRIDRAEIEKMREELIELLNRRDELNLALSELYTGSKGKKKSRSHAAIAETKEYKAKVKEFKRQRKLAKDMDRMSVSSDNRKKIYQLMDECVELAGKRAELEYRLRKEKIKGRAKGEAKKEIRKVNKDYKYASSDLKRLSRRAFEKAAKRKKSRHATALGVVLLLLLVGAGVAVYLFRDTIWQFITSFIPV